MIVIDGNVWGQELSYQARPRRSAVVWDFSDRNFITQTYLFLILWARVIFQWYSYFKFYLKFYKISNGIFHKMKNRPYYQFHNVVLISYVLFCTNVRTPFVMNKKAPFGFPSPYEKITICTLFPWQWIFKMKNKLFAKKAFKNTN